MRSGLNVTVLDLILRRLDDKSSVLDLSGLNLKDDSVELIALILQNNPHITELDLTGNQIHPESFEKLIKICSRDKQITQLQSPSLPDEIWVQIASDLPKVEDKFNLGKVCKQLSFFQSDAKYLALLEAILDDKRETVKKILDQDPQLLLVEPPKKSIVGSKLTWNRYYAIKKPLEIATLGNQLEMIKLLLPYFEQLEERKIIKDGKQEVLAQWNGNFSERRKESYALILKDLIDVIAKETFFQKSKQHLLVKMVKAELNALNIFSDRAKQIRLVDMINEETKAALVAFRKKLLGGGPDSIVAYGDADQLLIAAYQAFADHFWVFPDWEQRDLYGICVIGLIQSIQTPEIAKIICEGFFNFIAQNRSIGNRAKKHNLKNDIPFYRSAPDSYVGMGYDYFAGIVGGWSQGAVNGLNSWHGPVIAMQFLSDFEKICQAYKSEINRLKEELKKGYWPHHDFEQTKRNSCSMQ